MVPELMAVLAALSAAACGLGILLTTRRLRRLEALLALQHKRLRALEEKGRRLEEGATITGAAMMERGLLTENDLVAARERIVEGPRKRASEQDALLNGVDDADRLRERLVHVVSDRKH